MPFLLIGLLTVYTLAFALENPAFFLKEWYWMLVYYGTGLLADLTTTLKGLERGYREANPLYAKALAFGPLGVVLVDLGLLSLKAFFLQRLTGNPLLSYPLALAIGGHGHWTGALWNWGQLWERARPGGPPTRPPPSGGGDGKRPPHGG